MKGHNYGLCRKCGKVHISPKGALGKPAWNKGLTKDSDNRVKKNVESTRATRIKNGSYVANSGTFKKGQTRAHFIKGNKNPKLSEIRKLMYKKDELKRLIGKDNPMYCRRANKNQLKGLKLGNTGKKGKESNFWEGGITPLNNAVRTSGVYKKWRSNVFERDNFTCQKCNVRSDKGKKVYLEAHHYYKQFYLIIKERNIKTLEEALGCKELWDLNNGITLCRDCHNTIHS